MSVCDSNIDSGQVIIKVQSETEIGNLLERVYKQDQKNDSDIRLCRS
jgi:hypothetical protein